MEFYDWGTTTTTTTTVIASVSVIIINVYDNQLFTFN